MDEWRGGEKYVDVVSFEETKDPALHLRGGRTHRQQIGFVYDYNHWLFVDQFVQMGNDTSLEEVEVGLIAYGQIHCIAHEQNQRVLLERNAVDYFLRNRGRNLISLHGAAVP